MVFPNILFTGTPGTGKTSTAKAVASKSDLLHIELGTFIKEKSLHSGKDEAFDAFILDQDAEDKILDELEPIMSKGGVIIDHHGCSFFPERWFDLVIVLTTNNVLLYPRLEKRGYSDKKIQENIDCEIFQVVLQEAMESYDESIVITLKSETEDDFSQNVERITQWVADFCALEEK